VVLYIDEENNVTCTSSFILNYALYDNKNFKFIDLNDEFIIYNVKYYNNLFHNMLNKLNNIKNYDSDKLNFNKDGHFKTDINHINKKLNKKTGNNYDSFSSYKINDVMDIVNKLHKILYIVMIYLL